MNGEKLFLDTNIIVYFLSGDKTLSELLNDKTVYISFITELELLSYSDLSPKENAKIIKFLSYCTVIDVTSEVKSVVIQLRRKYKLKLPDSIIIASSIYLDIPLITADKAFNKVKELSVLFFEKEK